MSGQNKQRFGWRESERRLDIHRMVQIFKGVLHFEEGSGKALPKNCPINNVVLHIQKQAGMTMVLCSASLWRRCYSLIKYVGMHRGGNRMPTQFLQPGLLHSLTSYYRKDASNFSGMLSRKPKETLGLGEVTTL